MKPIQNVWLVDDDEIFVYVTKKIIEKTELMEEVTVFTNGQYAIDHLRKIVDSKDALPEIVFLDLMMPVLDGWGFLEEYIPLISPLQEKVALYILSSSVSPQDIQRARELNEVQDFVTKPITKELFTAIVDKYLAK